MRTHAVPRSPSALSPDSLKMWVDLGINAWWTTAFPINTSVLDLLRVMIISASERAIALSEMMQIPGRQGCWAANTKLIQLPRVRGPAQLTVKPAFGITTSDMHCADEEDLLFAVQDKHANGSWGQFRQLSQHRGQGDAGIINVVDQQYSLSWRWKRMRHCKASVGIGPNPADYPSCHTDLIMTTGASRNMRRPVNCVLIRKCVGDLVGNARWCVTKPHLSTLFEYPI